MELSIFAEQGRMTSGEIRPVFAHVTNTDSVTWQWGFDQQPLVRLGYHWRTTDGTRLPDDGRRSALPSTLHPGDASIVPVVVQAPVRPGRYVLEVDLVHEGVRWFGSPLCIDMAVESARNAARSTSAMHVTTIVARNYLARARVLATTFLRHHPLGHVVVLVIDAEDDESFAEPFDVVTPRDLPIDAGEFHRMAAIYDVLELATALKPFLLRHLLFDRRHRDGDISRPRHRGPRRHRRPRHDGPRLRNRAHATSTRPGAR